MSVHHVSSITHTLLLHALRVKQAYKCSLTAQEGHKVTLLTRGKKPVTFQIPDDTDSSYKEFQSAVQHIACDRTDTSAIQEKLGGKNFDGACYVLTKSACRSDGSLRSVHGSNCHLLQHPHPPAIILNAHYVTNNCLCCSCVRSEWPGSFRCRAHLEGSPRCAAVHLLLLCWRVPQVRRDATHGV